MPIGSGTVKLTEIINEFGTTNGSPKNLRAYLKCSSISSVNPYSGGQSGTTPVAPSTATHVKIRVWGGGGEGGGAFKAADNEIFYGGGGGAGGYVETIVPVIGGVTTFDYVVGTGGSGAGDSGTASTTDATAGGAGAASTVTGPGLSIAAGGGLGGLAAATGTYGDGGAGGSASGGLYNITGQSGKSGFDGGTGGFSEGAGAPRNRGANVIGSAPGGGGGGGANGTAPLTGTPYGGTNGGDGRIEFIWFTSGVAEHENNVSIPFTGTLNISNFRSSGSTIVSRDFQSDTYIGQYKEYVEDPNAQQTYREVKSGLYTAAASSSLGLVYGEPSGGTKGSIDVIGRSISGQNETAVLNSILDFRLSFYAGILLPTNCALVLNGDMRVSNWDIPWTIAAVTLNNTTITLHRANSIVPSGTYNSVDNVTYWAWYGTPGQPILFGFVNGSTTPYNFTCKVGIL